MSLSVTSSFSAISFISIPCPATNKIDSITSHKKNVYGECDIMYSYEIEGDTHEKDSYSR